MDLFSGVALVVFIAIFIQVIKLFKKNGTQSAFVLIGKIFKGNHQQNNFKWNILKQENSLFKSGQGIRSLINQNPQQFSLLSILPQSQFNTIKIISGWKLTNMNRLFLSGNNIQSIQQLSLLQMPNLQCLALNNNHVVTIRSLRKILSSNIIWIQINNNPLIDDLSALNELNMPYLQFLWLQFFQNDIKANDNIRWLSKSPSNNLQRFHIKSDWRIIEYKVLMVLKLKHLKIDIRVRY